MIWNGNNDIWPFSIFKVVPLSLVVEQMNCKNLSGVGVTYSGTRMGGQSTSACTKTGRVLSGAVTEAT